MSHPWIEYSVIAAYLLLMLVIGVVFKNFNKNSSDYFRGGSQGTWWIVGMSSFMAGISAFTFTGNGGAAFEAGWTVLIIYVANCIGLLLHVLFLAPWFRQMRATTFPEVIRARFGPVTQQVYAALAMLLFLIAGAVWLFGLAIFTATAFGLPIHLTIPVLGVVVLFYSTTGGKWAVMAADFVQGLIMMSMTLLIAVLCVARFGGIGGFFAAIEAAGLTHAFRFFKAPGEFPDNAYTLEWIMAMFVVQITLICSAQQAVKYFAVKDGREARRAALLTVVLMALGSLMWFVPPVAARILFAEEVLASGMSKPAEAAFAVASVHLLPVGLIGMMVVAMFSATMSSMDAGLNGNAAMAVRDLLPAICRRLGWKMPGEPGQILAGRIVTIAFGLAVIALALRLSMMKGKGVFEFVVAMGPLLVVPMSIPMLLCLFIRRVPPWAALASMAATLVPSTMAFVAETPWTLGEKTLWSLLSGTGVFLLSGLFWGQASSHYRQQVAEFFSTMHRPVDFAAEVGQANDSTQLEIMGRFSVAVGGFVLLLLLAPNPASGRWAIFSLAAFLIGVGLGMIWTARRRAAAANQRISVPPGSKRTGTPAHHQK
jgi:solute:Na+ symporter, SSS family